MWIVMDNEILLITVENVIALKNYIGTTRAWKITLFLRYQIWKIIIEDRNQLNQINVTHRNK